MTEQHKHDLTIRWLAAWSAQDIDGILACYTPDLVYVDPNTRGAVEGSEAMRRYLTKLFAAWEMTWAPREHFHHEQGSTVLWHATFRRAGESAMVEADGMDWVEYRNGLICRNEVRFDRSIFAQLERAA